MSQLAQVLEKRGEDVLQRWITRVRQHLAPGGESRAQLEDHIPLFLRQLQAALRGESSGDHTSPEAGTSAVGREHGAQRFHLGFSLGALVREYGVLRDVLLDLLVEERLQVSLEEVRLLTDFVATAIAEAVEAHARQQEQARHEQRMRQDARLAELFERVPAVVAHVSGPERIVDLANAAFRRLVGTEDVLGRPLRELFLETHARRLFALLEQVDASARMQHAQEVRLPGTPGRGDEDGFFELVAQPSPGAEGRPQGVFLHAQDVTAHVRARWAAARLEEDMRRSEAWLSTVLRSIGDAVIVTDAEGRAVFLNPVAEALTGWTTREARRESLARVFPIIHEHTGAPVDSPVDLVLRDGQSRGLADPTLLVRRDGTRVPIDDSVAPLRDAEGALSGAVLVFRDIADKRRQEKELRVFKALVEASGEYIVFVDLQGQVVYMNPAGRRLLGLSSLEQARAAPMLEYVSAESQERMAREVMPALLSGQPWAGELLHHHFLTGEAIPLAAHAVPIMDAQGRLELLASIGRDLRESKRQEAEREHLRRRAEGERVRLESLVQQAPAAIAVLRGTELVFESLNAETCRVWGRPREQLEGRPLLEALPELRGQGFDTLLLNVLATGTPHVGTEVAIPVQQPDGTRQTGYFNFTYAPWWNEPGSVQGVLIVAMEVTEAVRSRHLVLAERERADRARAAVLDALAEQTLVSLSYVRGPRHVFETANPLFRQLMARDVVGQDVWSAFPELLGPKFPAVMTQVFQSGVPIVAREVPMRVNQGEGLPPRDFLFDLTYQPVRSSEGEVDGVLTLAIEVTEQVRLRREAEKRAQEERARRDAEQHLRVRAEGERARLNALFQQAPVALGILRGQDIVIEVANPLLCQLWGRAPAQVLGLPAMDALPELRGMGLDDLVRGVMATGVPFVATEMQVHFSRGPGGALNPGFFNFVYDALRDEQGTIEGVILIAVEVTEQVLARQAAQGLAQEERRLRDFEQHLIGIVSHDLRNPLGAILLGLQLMLRREGLDARNTQSLVRLKSSAERAVRMVRDLLDFTEARLGGGLKMERAPVDVHALVRGVVDELLVTHPTRELRLEQRGEGRAHWDGDRVAQLLGNLVTNALKYSPPDSPVMVRSTGGPEEVRLEVHNGGAPIPPDAQPRLFQPLQRAVAGIDRATRSVGLGLYIVDQIVRAHGGDVQVTSSAEDGTRFSVRLPRGD